MGLSHPLLGSPDKRGSASFFRPSSQVDREEVRLRRTIGLKKDEYFLDKKHIT